MTDSSGWQSWVSRAMTASVALWLACTSFLPLFHLSPWMPFFEDDFYYYLKVAENFAHGAGSTFNGIVPTNGYHPLWFLVIAAFAWIAKTPKVLVSLLGVASILGGLSTYLLARRIFILSSLEQAVSAVLAALITAYAAPMFFGGMEVTIALPLVLLVMVMAMQPKRWLGSWRRSLVFGCVVSAMVLARLDTMIFAGVIFAMLLIFSRARRKDIYKWVAPSAYAGFIAGLSPVAIYFLLNRAFFHTLLPVSGMAKQLKAGLAPSAPALRSAFDTPPADQAIVAFILLMALLFPWLSRRIAVSHRAAYLAALVFPFLYIAILSCRSDWRLWPWYLYPFRSALCASVALFALWPSVNRVLKIRAVVVALALIAVISIVLVRRDYEGRVRLYDTAIDLQTFSITHHGVYAMGDGSGMVGMLLSDPVIQTEGLMMDRDFLTKMQRSTPLRQVLASYNVRYYITATASPPHGCLLALEPSEAGPASPHMSARFCAPPVATFVHRNIYTYIYDLSRPDSAVDPL